jgi:predicted enzyme related to lactoylglutathione lyase
MLSGALSYAASVLDHTFAAKGEAPMSTFNGNAVTWFEIPVTDVNRAVSFYETMLDAKLTPYPDSPEPYFIFPAEQGSVAGALVQRPESKPSAQGTMVFINVDGKLDASVKRAEKLGSQILVPRTQVPGSTSFYACLKDSEGNHVGLHSSQF